MCGLWSSLVKEHFLNVIDEMRFHALLQLLMIAYVLDVLKMFDEGVDMKLLETPL